jgi:hypothetical protein
MAVVHKNHQEFDRTIHEAFGMHEGDAPLFFQALPQSLQCDIHNHCVHNPFKINQDQCDKEAYFRGSQMAELGIAIHNTSEPGDQS